MSSLRSAIRALVLALASTVGMLLLCVPLFSQANQGSIQGAVTDQTGGTIAGAAVTVRDLARGLDRPLTTDSAGQYVAPNLTPGTYTVRAQAKGFQTIEHPNVVVEIGQNIRIDLVMQPGEQTQTVTVTSEAPVINTTDATLGGAVSNQTLLALPLNGRNYEKLLQLRPGVSIQPGGGTGAASTNGLRRGDDLFIVDGLANMNSTNGGSFLNDSYHAGDSTSVLPIDAIQEFDAEQNAKAEYGWRNGSVLSVGIKSGTNSLHGSAYAFGRSSSWDASNYFSGVTPLAMENYGATAGGRILKDKAFWFAGFEARTYTVGQPAADTIPSDVLLPTPLGPNDPNNQLSMVNACLFVGLANVNQLSARLAGLPVDSSNNPTSCTPQPASASFENVFPFNPNQSQAFFPNLSSDTSSYNGVFKPDFSIGTHHHFSGMFFDGQQISQAIYDVRQLLPQWEAFDNAHAYDSDVSWVWTPNSTWVNEARGGYGYFGGHILPVDGNKLVSNPWPAGYGINTGVTVPLYGGFPNILIGGFNSYLGAGRRQSIRGPEGTMDIVDHVSYLHGKHAFKFGFEFLNEVNDGDPINFAAGQIKFADLQHFLSGSPKSGTVFVGDATQQSRGHSYAGFFQDDWRMTKRVTLNLGLRYQYEGSPTERHNYIGNFNPNVNPATTPAVQQVGPGAPIPSMYSPTKTDFSPRFGVAWDVRGNGKTVVRAGASLISVLEVLGDLIDFAPFGANFPSIGVSNAGTAISAHTPESFSVGSKQFNWSLAGPVFPIANVASQGVSCAPATLIVNGAPGTPCFTVSVNPNFRTPYTAEWNLDIQRAITNTLTVEVAYVGNHGFKEASRVDINQPAIGAGWNNSTAGIADPLPGGVSPMAYCLASAGHTTPYDQCGYLGSKVQNNLVLGAVGENEVAAAPYTAKFPYLNYIDEQGNLDWSNYNGLQVTVTERPTHGLTFLAGYTFSHALDVISGNVVGQGQPFPIDIHNVRLNYGNSEQDIRNRFTLATTYAIPGIKSPAQMLQGWSISPIITLQGGAPWYPVDATNDLIGTGEFNNSGNNAAQFWNYTGPRSAFSSGPHSIPCFGNLPGCTAYVGGVPPTACLNAAGTDKLALASLYSLGCYVQNGGVLTPAGLGEIGTANRNIFRGPAFYNVDLSVAKAWKFKERYTAEFRAEFFNLFNRADFPIPQSSAIDPSGGKTFGCSCVTPDGTGFTNVLGSGGPREIQFGLKLLF